MLSSFLNIVAVVSAMVMLPGLASAYIRTPWHQLEALQYGFEHYVAEYGKKYETPEEFHERKAIFYENLNEIIQFNRQNHSWKKGVNQFTDRKHVEVKALLGYRPAHTNHVLRTPHPGRSLHKVMRPTRDFPALVDWRSTPALSAVKDQAGCGTCWAFSTSEVLESFYYLKTGKRMLVSPQQIASCTEIPEECWNQGKGGCQGSTQLLAYHTIMQSKNTVSEFRYPYVSWSGKNASCLVHPDGSQLRVTGYKVLPVNDYDALMEAVAYTGPVSINVDATYWSEYESGIFTGCSKDKVDINHAVQLVGYGEDTQSGLMYWIVRNSWNVSWGENGFMRLLRTSNSTCTNDPNAPDCMGGPTSTTVCGECGILYDSSYPIISEPTSEL